VNHAVEYTDEFHEWWDGLIDREQDDITAVVGLLEELGPSLGYPHSTSIETSRHGVMRELRVQSGGQPIRVFYAFDPRRSAILLIGGLKTGNSRFYERFVPIADSIYDEYLAELKEEGLIK